MSSTRQMAVNGIEMLVREQGDGPLVLLCHGWPELSYSWRHQLTALADAGYRVAAPDMRGFGATSAPAAIEAYTIFHHVGDMVALVGALGEKQAVIIGHDWGAPVAWHAALFRPDVFTAVGGLSVPPPRRGPALPLETLRQQGVTNFYWQYFQEPGVAEREFEQDVDFTMRAAFSKGFSATGMSQFLQPGFGFLGDRTIARPLPPWITEADVDLYAAEFARTGFRGGLNWYRNIDRNWELLAAFAGAKVTVPALYLVGELDLTLAFRGAKELIANLAHFVPRLRQTIMLHGCGHWTQQERAEEVSATMIEFLRAL